MKLFFTSALTIFSFLVHSQSNSARQLPLTPVEGQKRNCGTAVLPQQFEDWVKSITPIANAGRGGGGGENSIQSIFNIPVIVHVIHNNEALNSPGATSGGNLNAVQIIDQINILNKDFNGTNADTSLIPGVFKPRMGKLQLNFCLAVVNPTGGILAEPGIDRINRVTQGWTAPPYAMAYIDGTIKPNSIWNTNKYFNIWVMNLGGGLLGYATFPDPAGSGLLGIPAPYGNATNDGVVILNNAFGSVGTAAGFIPYNKGRTVTHEIGHWVGLRHVWGDAACGNDFCNDTPTQQTSNFGCPPFPQVTCGNGPNGDMHMNYMDYTDDACMYMFSKDQKYRAQLIMTNSPMRAALITSTVCNLPSIGNDIGITYVSSPTYSQVINCSNKITPVLNLTNYGSTTITAATIIYNVDGVNTQTVIWAGSLAPGTGVNYTLSQMSNLINGPHAFNATVTAPNGGADNNLNNNSNNQFFSIANSFTLAATSATICSGGSATLVGSGGAASYSWNPGAIAGATAVVSPTASTIYTLSGTSGTCVNTQTTGVTVTASLNITVNNPTICAGNMATVTASGAINYTWSTGSVVPSITVSPAATTVYTVNGSNGSCLGSKTATVIVNANPTVAVNSSTICSGNSATLVASGATTYSWSNGAATAIISVSPGVTTVYTVTGSNGACANTNTAQVTVNITPTVAVNSSTICSGNSTALTASGATTYSWSTGAPGSSISVSPSVTTIYTVTGTNGGCSTSNTSTVTINTTPTVTVNSATICSGNAATLTAAGAATYSWSTGAVTSSISPAPGVTSIYTVTGFNGACNNIKTTTVTVNATPTIAVNNATICSGNSALLNASGAGSYSWSTGALTQSVSVNPGATSVYTVNGTTAGCTAFSTATVNVNATPTININSFTICAGGSATLTAGGATTYSWSTGSVLNPITVTPSVTTVYSATGTTNGCSTIKTVTVTIGAALSVITNPAMQTTCAGSSATITASGATSYSWSNGAVTNSIVMSPTVNTNYTVVGTSGACTGSNTAAINVSPAATLNILTAGALCNGSSNGSATMTPSGGATPYTYSYSTGAITQTVSNLSAGTYTAIVTTSIGCVTASTFAITQPAILNLNTSVLNTSCGNCNGSVTYTASGGTPGYSYSISPGPANTNLCPGAFTIVTSDGNGCSKSSTVTVLASSNLTATANSANASCGVCADGSATVTAVGGNGPYTYTWMPSGGNASTANSLTSQCYSVTVADASNCITTVTTCVGSDISTGIKTNALSQFVIYPNPSEKNIIVEFGFQANRTVEIIDVAGRLIFIEKSTQAIIQLDISNYSNGVYFLKVKDSNGYHQFKIVKQ